MTEKTICFLITCAPLIFCLLLLLAASKNVRMLENHCACAVPPLGQADALSAFQSTIDYYRRTISFCAFWATTSIVACVFMLLIVLEADFSFRLAMFGVVAIVTWINIKSEVRTKGRLAEIFKKRPELARFKTLTELKKLQLESQNSLVCRRGSMDNPALILTESHSAMMRQLTDLEDKMLQSAHEQALNDETIISGEPLLVIFRGRDKRVKAFVAPCELVKPPVDEISADGISRRQIGRVHVSDYNFCGARIAHIDPMADPLERENSLKNDFLTHGWVATRDRAHILLTVLRWLSDDQRHLLYELINPGQPFPQNWISYETT